MGYRCVAVLVAVLAAEAAADPIQWAVSDGGNGHYYDLVFPETPASWVDARDAAASAVYLGSAGHLVTVTSAAENDFLRTTFAGSLTVQKFATGADQDGDLVYVGLSDAAVEGTFGWVAGEPVMFTDFGPFEPNNLGDQDYVVARVLDDGRVGTGPTWQWDDNFLLPTTGVARLGYIVEYDDPRPVPEPSPIILVCVAMAIVCVRRCPTST